MLKLRYKTTFPTNSNESRQLTVLTMPDSALCLCAARLYYFYDIKKLWLQNVYDEMEMVCIHVYQILLICYATENNKN